MPNLGDAVVSLITVYIDQSDRNTPAYLYAKQYDANSRFIKVTLMTEDGKYTPVGSCRLNAVRPDGAHVYSDGTINQDGTVTFGLTANMLVTVGNVSCDIVMLSQDSTPFLTSSPFYVVVDKSNYEEDAIEGTDEFISFEEAIAQAEDAASRAEAAAAYLYMEKTVDLSMAGGDQTVLPDQGKLLTSVKVRKPSTLLPGNILKNVNIGGVIGTYEGSDPYPVYDGSSEDIE